MRIDALHRGAALGAAAAAFLAWTSPSLAADPIRIAFGDIATVESLHFLAAIERTRARGVPVEVSFLKSEDIAAQAVVGGQADIGVGTPYALLQKVKAPIRLFFQMSTLKFYPVVNAEAYKSWKDLDGQEVAVHARGSGTEAIMMLAAQKNGIKFGRVSYVPGSEVRAGALLQGNIKASIVDSTNRRLLEQKAPGKFIDLPLEGVAATDEALYARTDFLEKNAAAVDVLVEELVKTWRDVLKNPSVVTEWRAQMKLLPDLPKDLEKDIVPYFTQAAADKTLAANGGGEAAAKDDLAFYSLAGQLQGDPSTLVVADFWDFRPLERALAKLGRN